jgi:hypothetical protein
MHINVKWTINCQLVDTLLFRREVEVNELSFSLLGHFCDPILQNLLCHLLKWLHKSVATVI